MSTKIKQTIYYKIVYNNNQLSSALAPLEMRITYIPKQLIKTSNFGKLCCFDTLQNAKDYLYQLLHMSKIAKYECWTCTIGKKYKYSGIPRVNPFFSLYIDSMNKIEKLSKQKKKYTHLVYENASFPKGTVFTDGIFLLDKINNL